MNKCAVVIKGGVTIGVATSCHSNVHVYKQRLICSDGTTSCPQPRCILHDAIAIEPTTSMAYAKENGSLQKFVRNSCMQAEVVGMVCNMSQSSPIRSHSTYRAVPYRVARYSTAQYSTRSHLKLYRTMPNCNVLARCVVACVNAALDHTLLGN